MDILPATQVDWPAIHQIYREGIRSGHATFQREDEIPDGATWFASKLPHLVFKAVRQHGTTVGNKTVGNKMVGNEMLGNEMVDGETVGWAALAPVSSPNRCAALRPCESTKRLTATVVMICRASR